MDFPNLLNPSPETETRPTTDTCPPTQQAPSSEDTRTISPVSSRSNPPNYTYSTATQQEAAQALASLSQSPQPPPAQWNGYTAPDANALERQRSWERQKSGFGDPIQLPPPPMGGDARKMSSPTLDQYHVASRSPEHRRQSMVSPPQANFTLPPLQGFALPSAEPARRQSQVSSHEHEVNEQQRTSSSSSHGHNSNAPSAALPSEPHVETSTQTPITAQVADAISPQQPNPQITTIPEEVASSPAVIKQENTSTPQPSSPINARRPSDVDQKALKAVTSLKSEHSMSKQSPLRESSVPIPSTEDPSLEQAATASKKRPAPAKTKKGTASMVKKDKAAPPAKKRKVETKKSGTPSTAKGTSAKGTPLNSSPAPSNRSYSADPDEETYENEDEDMEGRSDDGDEYCICRKPDNGTFMIGCDGPCEDWFHGKCVNIAERDKNLIDKYICPNCTEASKHGLTTWKRMCRRGGCRNAARLGKSKSGSGSKYCSDDCGVQYFREMVSRSRGSEETAKNRASRRKGSIAGSDYRPGDDDLGARGGALAAGEVKALLDSSKTADEFRKLGDGVLSPPATPDGKDHKGSQYTAQEAQAMRRIEAEKEEARQRHGLLKDRMKFVTLAKQAGSRTATEKELKSKDYCGYDPRLEWTNEQFQNWRSSTAAQQAFELDTLQVEKSSEEENGVDEDDADLTICDRKKCARHHEWSKLAVDSLRSEMNDNGDAMRKLEQEESDIKERAALRVKAGKINGEGTVEVHGLGIAAETPPDAMEIEAQTNGPVEMGER
ncbi:Set1 complex component spp1 [Fulvia fulva]|nr:Set1 complex component spp1 [Fulvia fulva]KAK4638477.1 Set1 complex component spp1 [Fulvia fulva]WPV09199.1 Set1 complex component spp1 [Fulvia fulva]WPV25043.1 Set1 complex component spp1 [Fulvia fulva]